MAATKFDLFALDCKPIVTEEDKETCIAPMRTESDEESTGTKKAKRAVVKPRRRKVLAVPRQTTQGVVMMERLPGLPVNETKTEVKTPIVLGMAEFLKYHPEYAVNRERRLPVGETPTNDESYDEKEEEEKLAKAAAEDPTMLVPHEERSYRERMNELMNNIKRPVLTAIGSLSHVSPASLLQHIRSDSVELDMSTAEHESELLRAGGWSFTVNGRIFMWPYCINGESKCVGSVHGHRIAPINTYRYVLAAYMKPVDLNRFITTGVTPPPRPCVLCHRKDVTAFIFKARNGSNSIILPEEPLNHYYNLCNEKGGYTLDYTFRQGNKYEGVIGALAYLRYKGLKWVVIPGQQPYIDQSEMIWKEGRVITPEVGSTLKT
jgi:hypothetical protein